MNKVKELSQEELRLLQLTNLEMLVEIDRICQKEQIQYSLDGGTLLGAVRHRGFIPWDDDADVVMERHEYAKFYRACKKELDTERFFLQEYRTDSNYRWGYAKMRRKGTEFVRLGQENMKYVTGVAMDIFPLDHVPDGYLQKRIYYGVNWLIRKALYSELGKEATDNALIRLLYKQIHRIPRDTLFHIRNKMAAFYNKKDSKMVTHTMFPNPGKKNKYGFTKAIVKEFEEAEFEGMLFTVTTIWDEYLTLLYEDYMKLPPKEQQVGHCLASKVELLPITLEEIQARYQRDNAIYHAIN